ncbi:MAG TPA: hypothetical protein VHD90_28495, partial [Phototrophicaceae bacterium]|nr:hypothetical protein [Phototrophicaceae bacterium]
MLRKLTALFAVLLILGVTAVSAQDDRSVYWQRWDVTINNVDTTHNHFDVTESYQIQFSGTFHSGYATIPLDYVTNINNVHVTEGG